MDAFVQKWGYLAVFFGSLVEGESIILPAGYFAAQGLLNLPKIILIAFIGTTIADQGLFFLGQSWGKRFLNALSRKIPGLENATQKAFSFLDKNKSFYILTFRFIYGVRIISPVVIGAAGVPFKRFAVLNILAAAVWSILSCGAGYLFGGFLIYYLSPIQRFFVIGSLGALCLCWLLWKGYTFFQEAKHEL